MENISKEDIERCVNILNNTSGITPQEQETRVKMWNEIIRFTNKQLEEITPIIKKYNETNKK